MTMTMTIVILQREHIQFEVGIMQTIKASEFKAKCLHLMDKVNQTGEEIIITKNGKPVSILKAYRTVPQTLFGMHKGKIQSQDDLIFPLDIDWDAA